MSVETVRRRREPLKTDTAGGGETSRWFAVKVQPRRDALAELHLTKQGFETFAPKVAAAKRAATLRGKPLLVPLFPGYLFVRLDLGRHRWRSVNGTIGVSHLVQFGDAPAAAPCGLIEGLRARTMPDGRFSFDEDLQVGEAVRVVGGAFDGWIGRLKGCDGQGRVAVLLEAFAERAPVRFPRGSIVRAA